MSWVIVGVPYRAGHSRSNGTTEDDTRREIPRTKRFSPRFVMVSVLSGHLRARLQDIAELSARIEELTPASHPDAAMDAAHEQL
ncbi:MAG: hypothetical protein AVDCRST_MAG26-1844 [uncultured Chloroflexia bacterium]|uniref:Uncharacterized protein n=1 Tax=uncultured Chloroflexia bacterium TaxID=1672391 RepID=A0A6J4IGA7_9CHLR|nr:MAG: hypothetical protein AVDCRST_MAG26-1844 [uncultured Chloroflexia bacterium]